MKLSVAGNSRRGLARESRVFGHGFTLLELLITIGIIVVLIGILIPIANSVRRQAKATTTAQTLAAIDAAIAQYQSDESDWPGPFGYHGSADFTIVSGGSNFPLKYSGTNLQPTRSEELFLCLQGGLDVQWTTTVPFTATAFSYLPDQAGRGHISLNSKKRQRYQAYLPNFNSISTGQQFSGDTVVPEFIDAFEHPILYVRAVKGVADTSAYMNALVNEGGFYNAPTWPSTYLVNDNLPGQTRGRDRYILISAGPNGIFGDADDITNFGQPKVN